MLSKLNKWSLLWVSFIINVNYSVAQNELIIEIDGKNLAQNNLVVLNAKEHEIIFHFPKTVNCSYQFRLEGLEPDWKTSQYPDVRYTSLSGGTYLFFGKIVQHQKAIKNYKIPIEIKEAFYETSWFWPTIGIYILLVIGIASYLFFLYDFRNKLKLQYIRNQIASDLHDEVGSNLNSIAIFIAVLRKKIGKDKGELLTILDKITTNSEETVSLMRETVWAINPDNDSSEKLFERLESLGFELLSTLKISFVFENLTQNQTFNISMEKRRNIYLIYKEAINNITKHAHATKVWVKLTNENQHLKISIKDNGIGFDKNQIFSGNGLKNFQNRAKNNEIEVFIDSEEKKGTVIKMEVAL